jgi:hypothetical protein
MENKKTAIIITIIIVLSILFMIGGALIIDLTDMLVVGIVLLAIGIVIAIFWLAVVAEVLDNL